MAKYGIATIFENLSVGYEFSRDNIPLHLTHVDSFQIDMDADALKDLLSSSLADQTAFDIRATKDIFYGHNKDILVTEIQLSPALLRMHSLIMRVLSDNNAVLKNPHFHNQGYSPHVSAYDERRVQPGDTLVVDNVIIAAKTSDTENATTRILAKIAL